MKRQLNRQLNIIELKQGGVYDALTVKIDNNLEIEIVNFNTKINININKITLNAEGFEVIENKRSSDFKKE